MKRFAKVILILAGFCFLFGTAITVAAASFGGRIPVEAVIQSGLYDRIFYHAANPSYYNGWFGFSHETSLATLEQEAEQGDSIAFQEAWAEPGDVGGIRKLKVSVGAAKVNIVEGEHGGSIYVKDAAGRIEWEQHVDGDTLELEFYRERDKIIKRSPKDVPYAVLVIPEGYEFEQVELAVGAGALGVERIAARELEIEAGAGTVSINSGQVEELGIDCQAGSVVYSGGVEAALETDCQAGSVEVRLEGKQEDFNYELGVKMGSIHIGRQKYSGLSEEREFAHEGAAKKAELECGMGSIRLSFMEDERKRDRRYE